MSDNEKTVYFSKYIWIGAGAGLLAILLLLIGASGIVVWKSMALLDMKSLDFLYFTVDLLFTDLIRILVVFIGGGISFAGLAVSFYAHENASRFIVGKNQENSTSKSNFMNFDFMVYSPGLVGVIVGAIIVITVLYSPPPQRPYSNEAAQNGCQSQETCNSSKPEIPVDPTQGGVKSHEKSNADSSVNSNAK